jgi:hypothetical protein
MAMSTGTWRNLIGISLAFCYLRVWCCLLAWAPSFSVPYFYDREFIVALNNSEIISNTVTEDRFNFFPLLTILILEKFLFLYVFKSVPKHPNNVFLFVDFVIQLLIDFFGHF